ncbi:MAG TPA: hypothetical protein VJ375_02745, partial [Gaiellaceae bacterium]|nr:hypothetical protein [Gaiellaceae bacterium]
MQHDAQMRGPLGRGRELEPRARSPHPLLGPADALRHGRLGHEEGVCDLRSRQAAHRAQRERELRRNGQRRVAAQEEEREHVVVAGRLRRVGGLEGRDRLLPASPGA